MANILPQQRLLLELISMSGNIAVPDSDNGTLLFNTLKECSAKGWIKLRPVSTGFEEAEITDAGRVIINDRHATQGAQKAG